MKHPLATAVEVAIGPGLEEAKGKDVVGIWCTCGSGRRLLLGGCRWGGGHAASVKPQQDREGAMKTSPSPLCPSSPDVPPMDWPNLKPEDKGHWAGWRKVECGSGEARESVQYPATLGR